MFDAAQHLVNRGTTVKSTFAQGVSRSGGWL
jgi:hypothetical protein